MKFALAFALAVALAFLHCTIVRTNETITALQEELARMDLRLTILLFDKPDWSPPFPVTRQEFNL